MSDPPPPSGPPPGWYPDSITGTGYRWWDGSSWSDHTSDDPGARSGPISQLEPVSSWLNAVFRIALSRSGHFLPMIVLLVVPTGLLNGFAVWLTLRDASFTSDSTTGELSFSNPSATAGNYWLLVVSLVASVLAWLLLTLAAARQANAMADDDPEPWSTSMLTGLWRFPRGLRATAPIVGAMVGIYLLIVIAIAIAPALGALLVLGALVLVPWLLVRLSLAQVGASLAPPGEQPVALSWQLTDRRFWAMFGRMALLLLMTVTLSLVASFLAAPFTAIAGGASTPIEPGAETIEFSQLLGDNPAVFAIGQLFNALASGASTVVWVVGLTRIYRALTGPVDRGDDDRSSDRIDR